MAVLKSDKSLFVVNSAATAGAEIIAELAGLAFAKGFVNETFAGNAARREEAYPTGLTMAVPLAIPHIQEGCLEPFFAMAVMEKPVRFENMGGGDTVMAELVFLFGLTNPAEQTKVLKKLAKIFQDAEILKRFKKCATPCALAAMAAEILDGLIEITA